MTGIWSLAKPGAPAPARLLVLSGAEGRASPGSGTHLGPHAGSSSDITCTLGNLSVEFYRFLVNSPGCFSVVDLVGNDELAPPPSSPLTAAWCWFGQLAPIGTRCLCRERSTGTHWTALSVLGTQHCYCRNVLSVPGTEHHHVLDTLSMLGDVALGAPVCVSTCLLRALCMPVPACAQGNCRTLRTCPCGLSVHRALPASLPPRLFLYLLHVSSVTHWVAEGESK